MERLILHYALGRVVSLTSVESVSQEFFNWEDKAHCVSEFLLCVFHRLTISRSYAWRY